MTDADTTVPVHVIVAHGTIQIDEAMQQALEAAVACHCVLVAGLVPTGYRSVIHRRGWQFSLSHWGRPPVFVSVHQYKRDAEAQVERVYRANSERDLSDAAVFAALIQELAAFDNGAVEKG